jgi:hypothetical protein
VNPNYKDLLVAFNAADVDYLVVGAHALAYHAEPRFTRDFDVWVRSTEDNAARVLRALQDFGAPLERIRVEDFSTEGIVYQMGVEPVRIDILTSISGVLFDDAFSRRITTTYDGVPLHVLSLVDLIANKEAAGRPQDLVDAEMLRNLDPGETRES